jgi:hypothetical protein
MTSSSYYTQNLSKFGKFVTYGHLQRNLETVACTYTQNVLMMVFERSGGSCPPTPAHLTPPPTTPTRQPPPPLTYLYYLLKKAERSLRDREESERSEIESLRVERGEFNGQLWRCVDYFDTVVSLGRWGLCRSPNSSVCLESGLTLCRH